MDPRILPAPPALPVLVERPGVRAAGPAVGAGVIGWALALLLLPGAPLAGGQAVLELEARDGLAGTATDAPLTGGTTTSAVGGCTVSETATVPAAAGQAHGSVTVTEPTTCATRTRVVILPALNLTNGLTAPTGHTLTAGLTITGLAGDSAMVASARLYLQEHAVGSPIVTGSAAVVTNGAIVQAASSAATLAARTGYGLGLAIRLILPLVPSTARLTVLVVATLDDGGRAQSVVLESVGIAFSY